MGLVVNGLLNKESAADVGASGIAIPLPRAQVMQKMGADSLTAMVRTAESLGIPSATSWPEDPEVSSHSPSLPREGHDMEAAVMELAEYRLETLREDEEFTLYRGRHRRQIDAVLLPVLVVAPVSERPALGSLRRMEHEYALRAELDP